MKHINILCIAYLVISQSKHMLKESRDHIDRVNYIKRNKAKHDHQHEVIIAVKQNNLHLLEDILYDVSTMTSKNYRKHKTREELGKLIENPSAALAVTNWIQSHGAKIVSSSLFHEYFTIKSSISILETMFQTTFHEYQYVELTSTQSIESNIMIIRAESYSIPEELIKSIESVFYIAELPPGPLTKKSNVRENVLSPTESHFNLRRHEMFDQALPITNPSSNTITPTKLASIYGIPTVPLVSNPNNSQSVYETNGQTYLSSDLDAFQSYYNLPNLPAGRYGTQQNNTICKTSNNFGLCAESSLDLQYIMSASLNVPTIYWYDTTQDGSMVQFVVSLASNKNLTDVYSISYGGNEVDVAKSAISTFNTEAMKLGILGITLVVSAGGEFKSTSMYSLKSFV